MEKTIIFAYGGPLILLYLCILMFSEGSRRPGIVFDRLLIFIGIVPGLLGVIYGFLVIITQEQRQEGLGILTAWLLLEMGALQLRRTYIRHYFND